MIFEWEAHIGMEEKVDGRIGFGFVRERGGHGGFDVCLSILKFGNAWEEISVVLLCSWVRDWV